MNNCYKKNEKGEKVIFLEAEPDEARQARKYEAKKHAVALLILKALSDHLERSPESRLDLPPAFNEQGESMCPGNTDIFYAPLSPETGGHREAAFIYAR